MSFLTQRLDALRDFLDDRSRKLSAKEESNLLRQLALLLNSGVPFFDSISSLAESMTGAPKALCLKLADDVYQGVPLSSAIARQREYLSKATPHLISAGERTGRLVHTLRLAAEWAEHHQKLMDRTKSALIYPAFVLATNFLLAGALLTFILPAFKPLFGGKELPLLTQLVLGISGLLQNPLFWVVMFFVVVELCLLLLREEGRIKLYRIGLHLPALGPLLRSAARARFLSILGLSAQVGLKLTESLKLAARASGDPEFLELDKDLQTCLTEGEAIDDYFRAHQAVYGPLLHQVIQLCVETGKFEHVCEVFSQYFAEETEHAAEMLKALLEPLLMVFVAVSTATILLSVYMPLASLIKSLMN